MAKPKAETRTRLLQAAVKVTYAYGFGNAAIADIAKEARVPLGNIYYHFKTKDEIGDAIVQLRLARFRRLLQELDKADSHKERLCSFVQIKIKNREALARGGCPVGTLCSNCKSAAARWPENRQSCSRRLSPGWRCSSRLSGKERIRADWPCIFCRPRKAYRCWLTLSATPT